MNQTVVIRHWPHWHINDLYTNESTWIKHALRIPFRDILHIISDRLFQRPPSILVTPLFQQSKRLTEISCHGKCCRSRDVIDKFSMRIKLANNGEHIIPVAVIRPRLKASILDLRIQHCCNVKQSDILDINMDY